MGKPAPGPRRRGRMAAPVAEGRDFLRQVLVFYGIGALFVAAFILLWLASSVLLVVFAGLLLAILLDHLSRRLRRWLPFRQQAVVSLLVVGGFAVLGLGGWLLAPGVAEQTNELLEAIPRAVQQLQNSLRGYGFLQQILGSLPSPAQLAKEWKSILPSAGLFFSGIFGLVANMVIMAVLGIYFALRPGWYVRGFVLLFPPGQRGRVCDVLEAVGHTLGEWLMGKALSMLIIGIATALGLGLLGVPLAMVLGILAGVLDFIPYIGPLLAGVPAILIAFAESPLLAFYVILLFIALQTAEGYVVVPLIERRTVSLPPAVTIVMQMIFGSFFGLVGVALATPVTAAVAVVVTMLYVQDVLGEEVAIPGGK